MSSGGGGENERVAHVRRAVPALNDSVAVIQAPGAALEGAPRGERTRDVLEELRTTAGQAPRVRTAPLAPASA